MQGMKPNKESSLLTRLWIRPRRVLSKKGQKMNAKFKFGLPALAFLLCWICSPARADSQSAVLKKITMLTEQLALAQRTHYVGNLSVTDAKGVTALSTLEGFVDPANGQYVYGPDTKFLGIDLHAVGAREARDPSNYFIGFQFEQKEPTKPGKFFLNSSQWMEVNMARSPVSIQAIQKFAGTTSIPGLPESATFKLGIGASGFGSVGWIPFDRGQVSISKTSDLTVAEMLTLLSSANGAAFKSRIEFFSCSEGEIVEDVARGLHMFHLKDYAYASSTEVGLAPYQHFYVIPFSADVAVDVRGNLVAVTALAVGMPFRNGGYNKSCVPR
jgi:hypothetical protein